MPHAPREEEGGTGPVKRTRFQNITRKLWWLHSFGGLTISLSMMLLSRAGLAYADKLLIALIGSWLLVFVALRFIVGPANRKDDEHFVRKGVRVATNYIIKQFYQQMFFFLVPIYASSATWALGTWNWWLAPILFVCGVLSTIDLVFDNFIMERRWLASIMYGLALFGMINVLLPLTVGITHFEALLAAAAMTPTAVALLSFSVGQVVSPQGVLLALAATAGLVSAVWYGREFVPPAPLAMTEATVGHGTYGGYECLPPSKHVIRADQLDNLRCGSLLREPGGLKEDIVHIWRHGSVEVARVDARSSPALTKLEGCDGPDNIVYRSELPKAKLPKDPTGEWSCTTETVHGQLVGIRKFEVVGPETTKPVPAPVPLPVPDGGTPKPPDAAPARDSR
ncbi:MAG TPA: DUF5924 family protein [Kofleriaceae bacterium]|nr:DUF5924 family protein [Kofleriaceae bacterium]